MPLRLVRPSQGATLMGPRSPDSSGPSPFGCPWFKMADIVGTCALGNTGEPGSGLSKQELGPQEAGEQGPANCSDSAISGRYMNRLESPNVPRSSRTKF